jgi:hypothetical protein
MADSTSIICSRRDPNGSSERVHQVETGASIDGVKGLRG